MMLSWLVITNHCALARIASQQAPEAEVPVCHKTGAPEKNAPCPERNQCCKEVKASLSDKAGLPLDVPKVQVPLHIITDVFAEAIVERVPIIVFDHGPPRAVSFAELVLQRSLPSHAPPAAV